MTKRDADDPPLDEIVRSQASQIAALISALDRQSRMFDAMMERPALLQVPPPAPEPVVVPPPAVLTGPTFAALWSRYREFIASKPWASNVESMMSAVLIHFAPSVAGRIARAGRYKPIAYHGPDMLAMAIRPYHWTDFRDELIRRRPDLSVGFRNLMLKRTRVVYNWAVDDERLLSNPIERVKIERPRPKRQTVISEADLAQLLERCDLFLAAYLLAIMDSGMRPGEVRTLKWSQLDLETGRVELSWTTTKSKRTRITWITPRVTEKFRQLPRIRGNEYVFASPSGHNDPLSKTKFCTAFARARDAIGLRAAPGDVRVRAHDGRRSFASQMVRAGAEIMQISELLGHASIETTADYVTVGEADLLEAHGRLQNAIRKGPYRMPRHASNKTPTTGSIDATHLLRSGTDR